MAVCDSCETFKAIGKKCWYFWDNKRACSQHRNSQVSEPNYHEEPLIIIRK